MKTQLFRQVQRRLGSTTKRSKLGSVSAASSGSEGPEMEDNGRGHNGVVMSAAPVRTSSCTKEEVDAILIQCGRLSRSSSGKGGPGVSTPSKKYSGSNRSYDFDQNDCDFGEKGNSIEDDVDCVGYDSCFLDYHVRTQSIIIMERN